VAVHRPSLVPGGGTKLIAHSTPHAQVYKYKSDDFALEIKPHIKPSPHSVLQHFGSAVLQSRAKPTSPSYVSYWNLYLVIN
jgi:hypothetical protein